MIPIWRYVPRTWVVYRIGIQSAVTPPTASSLNLQHVHTGTRGNMDISLSQSGGPQRIEGVQGPLTPERSFNAAEGRDVLSSALNCLRNEPTIQGFQDGSAKICSPLSSDVHAAVYEGLNGHVGLSDCTQSNVPRSTSSSSVQYDSFLGMPGASGKLFDKYISAERLGSGSLRQFSTSTVYHGSIQGAQDFLQTSETDNETLDRCPQGIQGDDCVRFKLWMENCQRYHLPNCDDQAKAITTGKKTLAQVFKEQEEIIREVAESYRQSQTSSTTSARDDAQGVQDAAYGLGPNTFTSCPQGIQGEDCDTYQLWAYNCDKFGFQNCQEDYDDLRTGRRSLKDIFDEQDKMIREVVQSYQQRREYSTQSSPQGDEQSDEVGMNSPSSSSSSSSSIPPPGPELKLSQKERLKRAVKEYGATVIVFHVGLALTSLGGFYAAVSSGLDVVGLLSKIGFGDNIVKSQLASGASTFVIAYAVHKVFAPVRIGITLTCTPLIVRYLRQKGILKPPKIKTD